MPYSPTLGTRPEDLTPNVYSPAANGLASEVEMYTIYDRPIAEQMWLFERHAGYVGFATMLAAMGFRNGSNTPTIGHYENPWTEDLVKIGSIVTPAGGAGNDIVVALHADNMYNTAVTSGGSARQASYPVVGDVIETYDRVQARVTAKDVTVNPHRLTLTPLKSTVDLDSSINATESYGILYNLFAEGSELPKGRAPRIVKYTNTFGVVKHSFGSTGHELTNAVYHEVIPGDESSAGDTIFARIKADEIRRYEMSRSGMLVFGQTADNLTELVTETNLDTDISSTEGFVDFALTSGTTDTYTAGTYTIQEFDDISNVYFDERVTNNPDIICWDGPDISTETENAFVNVLQQNLAPFVDRIIDGYGSYRANQFHEALDGKSSDATLAFGYSAIQKNGFVYHFKRLSEFNDIRRAGGSSYGYRKWRIAMPITWTTDSLSGNRRPTIGYEFKQLNDYSRENVFGDLPGAGVGGNTKYGKAVKEADAMKYFLISHIAMHCAVGNGLVVQQPA